MGTQWWKLLQNGKEYYLQIVITGERVTLMHLMNLSPNGMKNGGETISRRKRGRLYIGQE